MNRYLVVGLTLLLLAISCSRSKEQMTLVIQWQKADTDACLACQNTGASEKDIQKAFETLTRQLASKGIRVELVEKKAVPDTAPEIGSGQIWLGNMPVENWLGGSVDSQRCFVCPAGPHGKGHLRKTLKLGDTSYESIPVELMVRAGMTAAEYLEEQKTESGKQK